MGHDIVCASLRGDVLTMTYIVLYTAEHSGFGRL